jgi:hypothetical protein
MTREVGHWCGHHERAMHAMDRNTNVGIIGFKPNISNHRYVKGHITANRIILD